MNRNCYSKNSYSSENIFIRDIFGLNRFLDYNFKTIILLFCFVSISLTGISQNSSSENIKSPLASVIQQTEPVNVYYDTENDKFVIENNSLQNRNFTFGIYNITGTPIKQFQIETNTGKNSEIQIELNAGIYIVNITEKSFSYTKKFIIR